jgi:hypothetical protein
MTNRERLNTIGACHDAQSRATQDPTVPYGPAAKFRAKRRNGNA